MRLLAVAEKALADSSKHPSRLLTLGAALCRAGRYEDAAAKLNESAKLRAKEGPALDWLFLAIARHHLGQADVAKKYLDEASRWVDQNAAPEGSRLPWPSRLELNVLRREVTALLTAEKP